MYRRGDDAVVLDLCRACSELVQMTLLLPMKGDPMTTPTIEWSIPVHHPDDVDDAMHPVECDCDECSGVIDFRVDFHREERIA